MAASILGRQLRRTFVTISPISTFLHRYTTPQPPHFPSNLIPLPHHHLTFRPISYNNDSDSEDRRAYQNVAEQILYKVEQQKRREKEARQKAGLDTADLDAEGDEDYMGVGPLIEKLEKEMLKKGADIDLNRREEPSDSESDEDEDAYKDYDAIQRSEMLEEKLRDRYEVLFENFMLAGTADEGYKWMKKIDQFEEKYLQSRSEFRVICDLMNRLKVATGKEKFLLQHKLNRAIRLIKYKDKYDPNNPANYGVIPNPEQPDPSADHLEGAEVETEKQTIDEDGEEEFDDMKHRDDILLEQLNAIDKKLEEKLADLDHTFGKKGKVLEEEIRDLAEERSFLTEKKRRPLFRKGFDVKLIDVNRTCKVTKGGQVIKYSAMLACGNYHGVIGFAKAKGPSVDIALQKAHEKCFQNLHYVERHEEHTIAHAVQTSYKKTKLYLWPAKTQTGMKAGRTVQTILYLAGFKNLKSKVIGSRNPHNTVKALFKALNAIETPKDVQEKFGRTVVESYLL